MEYLFDYGRLLLLLVVVASCYGRAMPPRAALGSGRAVARWSASAASLLALALAASPHFRAACARASSHPRLLIPRAVVHAVMDGFEADNGAWAATGELPEMWMRHSGETGSSNTGPARQGQPPSLAARGRRRPLAFRRARAGAPAR